MCVAKTSLSRVHVKRSIGIRACFDIERSTVGLCKFETGSSLRVFGLLLNIGNIKPGTTLKILTKVATSRLEFTVLSSSIGALSGTPNVKGGATRGLVLRLGSGVGLRSTFRLGLTRRRRETTIKTNRISSNERRTIRTLITLKCDDTSTLHTIHGIASIPPSSIRNLLGTTLGGFWLGRSFVL